MRTYTHTLLTLAAARGRGRRTSLWAALGATVPDLPAGAGAAWLWARRKRLSLEALNEEVCGRSLLRIPDATLHSALPVAVALALYAIPGVRSRDREGAWRALLLGWAGHVLTDALTHGKDARPLLWPLSDWRFRSPVSYWEHGRYSGLFTAVEHVTVLAATAGFLLGSRDRPDRP